MSDHPTLNTAALATLELAVNKLLDLDPALHQKLTGMSGTVLLIRCTIPRLDVFILPDTDRVRLAGYYDGKADSTLSGPASEYIKLSQAQDKASALVNGGLTITGDSRAFVALQEAIAQMDPDFEQKVADLIGDVAAHQLGRLARNTLQWGRLGSESVQRHIEEYIHEEARLAPSRLEVEDFFEDIQKLTSSVKRLETSLKNIRRTHDKKQPPKSSKTSSKNPAADGTTK